MNPGFLAFDLVTAPPVPSRVPAVDFEKLSVQNHNENQSRNGALRRKPRAEFNGKLSYFV
jgi:hypothetical protein